VFVSGNDAAASATVAAGATQPGFAQSNSEGSIWAAHPVMFWLGVLAGF
jgi:hypothetical protein